MRIRIAGAGLRHFRPIFLIGMPGAGKTAVGREASRRFHLDWMDTDVTMAQEVRNFPQVANPAAVEAETLQRIFRHRPLPQIVSTGGSVPCVPGTRDAMRSRPHGVVVWLRPTIDRIAERIGGRRSDWETRGVFMGSCETLEELEADRRSHYSACADLVFEDYPFEDSVAAIGELARSKTTFLRS